MEQLIFVGIILLFSILEAVARKGRAGQGGEEGIPLPESPEERRPRPRPRPRAQPEAGTVPRSYDEDASFDEAAGGDEARRRPEPRPWEGGEPEALPAPAPSPARSGSEGLIPSEVWDEIQRMARGEPPGEPKRPEAPRPAPVPAPQRRAPKGQPVPARPRPAGKAKPTGRSGASTAQPRTGKSLGRPAQAGAAAAPAPEGTPDHPVHLSHAEYGLAPSLRGGGAEAGAGAGHAPAAALRRLLTSDPASLRQAMILQEVLGPPPGLREG